MYLEKIHSHTFCRNTIEIGMKGKWYKNGIKKTALKCTIHVYSIPVILFSILGDASVIEHEGSVLHLC